MTAATAPHDPLAALCSPYTGIVSTVEECLCMPTDARLIRVACELASSSSLLGASLRHIQGVGGAGFTLAEARAAAVGEAAERYSASHLPRERFVEASADELGAGAVDPERFALFARDQYETDGFPFVPFHRGTRVQWVEGIALPGREPAWIPVELVYLADAIEPGRPRIGYATSSGMACAGSEIEAVERGLLELLERDAFMLAWSNRLSLPRVDWKDHAEAAALERRYFAPSGLAHEVVDLSAFHDLPTMLAVVRAPAWEAGAVGVGAAASAEPLRAWWKALGEAFASRAAGQKMMVLDPGRRFRDDGLDVGDFDDHILFYADRERARAGDFLDGATATVPLGGIRPLPGGSVDERIAELLIRVGRAGSSAYVVDVTAPDIASVGLHVVKLVTPELCALDVPHAARFLGGSRLWRGAVDAGLRREPLGRTELNPHPHPFP